MTKINKPITACHVITDDTKVESIVQHMHENVVRPERLHGSTYKIKTPLSDHALYITINNIVLNVGDQHEVCHPFEIFINSKAMDHFQWIVALTRIISAVFRKGGDVTFLVEELRSVFDPKGGYFKKGGKYMPSLVAEIGDVIETHLRSIGLMKSDELDDHQQAFIKEQRAKHGMKPSDRASNDFPDEAVLCAKCQNKSVMIMDGCLVCLNCGESRCG
jgi:hypothetical protein